MKTKITVISTLNITDVKGRALRMTTGNERGPKRLLDITRKLLVVSLFVLLTELACTGAYAQCNNRFKVETNSTGKMNDGRVTVKMPGAAPYNVYLYKETATGDVLVKEYKKVSAAEVQFINLSTEPLYLVKVEFLALQKSPKCFSRMTLVRFLTGND